MKKVEIEVYGAEQICASCVNLPSSWDTYEWLDAALKRKYPGQPFSITYIDIYHPPEVEAYKEFAARMIEEEAFYPLVAIEGELIAEGNIPLKKVTAAMERHGYTAK